jgi:hypothetical protein
VPTGLADDLRRRIAGCQTLRGVEVTPALVSRSGFAGEPVEGVVLIDLSTEEVRA